MGAPGTLYRRDADAAGFLSPRVLPARAGPADDQVMVMAEPPRVHRVGGLIGAEIRGLDLTRGYPDETYQAVRQARAEHGVIFFREQHLTAEQREGFARRFGEIRTMQQLRKEPDQVKNVGESWHVDMTCFDEPPIGTILFAQECPNYGGDTLWAGLAPAFEALSEGRRHTLTGLRAARHQARVRHPVPLGARLDRVLGQPPGLAPGGQRLPRHASRHEPHPAGRHQNPCPPADQGRYPGGGASPGRPTTVQCHSPMQSRTVRTCLPNCYQNAAT
jgi:hypothetical protein